MELKRIKDPKSEEFRKCWQLYKSAFPEINQRTLRQQNQVMVKNEYNFISIRDKGEVIGLVAFWNFKYFIFGEHLALKEKVLASGIILQILEEYRKSAVIDIDLPVDRKLLRIYENTGFRMNPYRLVLPPYKKGDRSSHIAIMSFPDRLSRDEYERIKETICKKVYGLEKKRI